MIVPFWFDPPSIELTMLGACIAARLSKPVLIASRLFIF